MTRKRFVKLLMADGYSRNKANTLVAKARNCGLSYSTAYKAESAMPGTITKLNNIDFTAMCDAFGKVVEAVIPVIRAFTKAAVAFVETYKAEMEATNE